MMENCHVDVSLPFYPSLAHALFLSSLFCISSRWKLHLLQSSFLPKSQGQSICGMRGKKVLGCSFHHWDNYPHCDLNDPSCSACVSCTRPAARLQALSGSSPLPMPCVREYENLYNETILSDGKKRLLELHLLQRRLNYMSNCDNFPSIHSPFWKGRKRGKTEKRWKGNYTDNIECRKRYTLKNDCKKSARL